MKKNKLLIYGNGKMAKMLYPYLKKEYDVLSFIVEEKYIKDLSFLDVPVMPYENLEKLYAPEEHLIIIAVGYAEMNLIRERKYFELKKLGYEFINYIHPSVYFPESMSIGDNNIVMEYVSIHPYSSIGAGNFISSNSNIGHDCIIGNFNWINSGVSLAGGVTVNNNCVLGINSTVSHGVFIENECFIGATCIITQNTEKKEVYLPEASTKFRLDSKFFLQLFNNQ
jgi:sugar O-acyltransferase (sialic acid O-acetyltransferase NeuD family)